MTAANPYAPPSAEDITTDARFSAFGELVRSWEKLRLYYNAILILPGLGVLALWITRQDLPVPAVIVSGILTAIGANAAFFLGPLAELYIRGLLGNGTSLGHGRLFIFGAGLLVSACFFGIFAIITFL